MNDAPTYDEDDIATAGEYVLLLLDAPQTAAFESRLQAEPPLRQLVTDWQEGLSTLTDEVAEAPPAQLWARIERAAHGGQAPAAPATFSVSRWLVGALAAVAVAAVAFVMLPTAPLPPTHGAEIAAEDGSLVIQARYDGGGQLSLTREAGGARPGRALELWLIAEGADAPVSLGVLPDSRDALIDVPVELRAAMAQGTLAISDEPPGGSPTGAPTGEVLAAAPVRSL